MVLVPTTTTGDDLSLRPDGVAGAAIILPFALMITLITSTGILKNPVSFPPY